MPDTLTQDNSLSDNDIAFLSKIGEFNVQAAKDDSRGRLERLMAQGYIAPSNAEQKPAKYQLTEKAEQLLISRGAGLNEA